MHAKHLYILRMLEEIIWISEDRVRSFVSANLTLEEGSRATFDRHALKAWFSVCNTEYINVERTKEIIMRGETIGNHIIKPSRIRKSINATSGFVRGPRLWVKVNCLLVARGRIQDTYIYIYMYAHSSQLYDLRFSILEFRGNECRRGFRWIICILERTDRKDNNPLIHLSIYIIEYMIYIYQKLTRIVEFVELDKTNIFLFLDPKIRSSLSLSVSHWVFSSLLTQIWELGRSVLRY